MPCDNEWQFFASHLILSIKLQLYNHLPWIQCILYYTFANLTQFTYHFSSISRYQKEEWQNYINAIRNYFIEHLSKLRSDMASNGIWIPVNCASFRGMIHFKWIYELSTLNAKDSRHISDRIWLIETLKWTTNSWAFRTNFHENAKESHMHSVLIFVIIFACDSIRASHTTHSSSIIVRNSTQVRLLHVCDIIRKKLIVNCLHQTG